MCKLLFLAFLCGAAWASDVLELTDDDFDSRIGDHPLVLVEFFAPWCGHCKRLAPEYEVAATRLKGTASLAKVDCTVQTNVCGKYKVSGYPTLKIFRGGEDTGGYEGPRNANGIVKYLEKQAAPASVEITTAAEFDKYVGENSPSVVGFFADSGNTAQEDFLKSANALRESCRFAHTNSEELLQKNAIEGEGVILFRPPRMSNKFEDSTVKFAEEKFSFANMKPFIEDNMFGMCPVMTADNRDQLKTEDLLVAYYDLDYEKNPKGSNYWRNRVMKVAKSFVDQGKKMSYAVADKGTFGPDLGQMNIDISKELPVVVIHKSGFAGNSYIMAEEFSRDGKALERFLNDYLDGKLKRFIKSEPIPASNDGPVKVVVGETFDELVDDESKDVLIEFYAPWCGHCKTLEPIYKDLGERLSGDPNVVIAKMDATANSVPPHFEVKGFPTIYFSPIGQKQNPKKYEGGREVSDFLAYLKKEATNPLVAQEEPKKKKKKKSEL